jgi:hypothetical protein
VYNNEQEMMATEVVNGEVKLFLCLNTAPWRYMGEWRYSSMQVSGQLDTYVALTPLPAGYEAGWVPERVWTLLGIES